MLINALAQARSMSNLMPHVLESGSPKLSTNMISVHALQTIYTTLSHNITVDALNVIVPLLIYLRMLRSGQITQMQNDICNTNSDACMQYHCAPMALCHLIL